MQPKWWMTRGPLLAWVLLVVSADAFAVPPESVGFGLGRAGQLTLMQGLSRVNDFTVVSQDVSVGDVVLTVADVSAFAPGDLAMLLQSQSNPAPDGGPLTSTGRYEFVRVAAVGAAGPRALSLSLLPEQSWPRDRTQVVRVPEYSDVTIGPDAGLSAVPWNGTVGGVLAFTVSGVLSLDGQLTADGLGFRGAPFVFDGSNPGSCPLPFGEQPSPQSGFKGESGVAGAYLVRSGFDSLETGGGGGMCLRGGGGGGASAGHGGSASLPVGGRGALGRPAAPGTTLAFGGGGGAAHASSVASGAGSHGGGAVLVHAARVTGTGSVSADGLATTVLVAAYVSAGGAGAGGTVVVRSSAGVSCGSASATGGTGVTSNFMSNSGFPGGGGGGGRVYLRGPGGCSVTVAPGLGGGSALSGPPVASPTDFSSLSYFGESTLDTTPWAPDSGVDAGPPDAGPPDAGLPDAGPPDAGLFVPAALVLRPVEGALVRTARPVVSVSSVEGTTVTLRLDSLAPEPMQPLEDGGFRWVASSDLAEGMHVAAAVAHVGSAASLEATVRFVIDTVPPATPVITEPAAGAVVATGVPSIDVTSDPGTFVDVSIDGVVVASDLVVGSTGTVVTGVSVADRLAKGLHTVTARARDLAGNSTETSQQFQVGRDVEDPTIRVGSSCSGVGLTGGAGSALVVLLVARRRRRGAARA